jgi:PadR family transcriptional regulator PadR
MVENIKSQMRKGILEYCILSIIERRESYTTDIAEMLKSADLLVVEGTLYPLLSRLKNNGMLTYRWEESTSGPPRKYFCLTDTGRQLLEQLRTEWLCISKSINMIEETKTENL